MTTMFPSHIMLPNPKTLSSLYPWTKSPLIAAAPMRLLSTAPLAHAVSRAGGLGFIGAGTDMSSLPAYLSHAHDLCQSDSVPDCPEGVLPIGVGVITHVASLATFVSALKDHAEGKSRGRPAAVWLFAPTDPGGSDLQPWIDAVHELFPPSASQDREMAQPRYPQIWFQAGSVAEAIAPFLRSTTGSPPIDVLVLQTPDAGGHGLNAGAGLPSLVPETLDALENLVSTKSLAPEHLLLVLAAGGICTASGAAAALAAGAHGVVMGTAYLATAEASIHPAYQRAVLDASDGGQSTARTSLYDHLRGTRHWPDRFGGRGVKNASWDDWVRGRGLEELERAYREAEEATDRFGDQGWGIRGRLTTYAGTGVGLVNSVRSADDVTREVREGCRRVIEALPSKL